MPVEYIVGTDARFLLAPTYSQPAYCVHKNSLLCQHNFGTCTFTLPSYCMPDIDSDIGLYQSPSSICPDKLCTVLLVWHMHAFTSRWWFVYACKESVIVLCFLTLLISSCYRTIQILHIDDCFLDILRPVILELWNIHTMKDHFCKFFNQIFIMSSAPYPTFL